MTTATRHWYSRTAPTRRPSDWWYYGRALYVSRRDYFKIYLYIFWCLGVPLALAGWLLDSRTCLDVAFAAGGVAIIYQLYSLLGMFRMYGPPARGYLRKLLKLADVSGPLTVADLHVGTYRHSYLLADLLPEAVIHSVDCWETEGRPAEEAIADVRDLESPPEGHPRIRPTHSQDHKLPFDDASVDVVVFGFGTHEIPTGGPRESLFAEARRVLRPGGKALIFEHGNDFHNTIVFGPVIGHVTRREEWMKTMGEHFANVGYARSSYAVDLFWGTKGGAIGNVVAPLPRIAAWLRALGILSVIGTVSFTTFCLAVGLTGVSLYPYLLGIAIAGLALPWAGIFLMRAIDRMLTA
jgi:ubiquinone/menaquinone biosynthesis C-methylase UbiE